MDVGTFLSELKIAVDTASPNYILLIACALSAIWLMVMNPRMRFLIASIFVALLVLVNPLSGPIIMNLVDGAQPFSRFIWILFPEIFIALAACDVAFRFKKIGFRLVSLLAASALIFCLGANLLCQPFFTYASNHMKIYQDALEISDYIAASQAAENAGCDIYAEEGADESTLSRAIVSDTILPYVRQAHSDIHLYYGRHRYSKNDHFFRRLEKRTEDPESFDDYMQQIRDDHVTMIVMPESAELTALLASYGWYIKKWLYGYNFYVPINGEATSLTEDGTWDMTSFEDAGGAQSMCYAIYNLQENKLIMIDGGWADNAEAVREIIHTYGNDHVDAWFLTHYHSDHIGAFNQIYQNPDAITIDNIYVSGADSALYHKVAKDWDNIEEFELFEEQTEGDSSVKKAVRGQSFEYDGLKIDVLNAYDDVVVNSGTDDIPNDCSLMLKISSANRSALMCADCHTKEMADILISEWGDTLKADIVQCGHHGNNSFPEYFYDKVEPNHAIFDLPDSYINDESLTAGTLKEYFDNKGVSVYSFSTGPNSFTLY